MTALRGQGGARLLVAVVSAIAALAESVRGCRPDHVEGGAHGTGEVRHARAHEGREKRVAAPHRLHGSARAGVRKGLSHHRR